MSAPDVMDAGPAHARVLAALHAQAFDAPWDAAAFAAALSRPGALALIATAGDDGAPLGFVLVRVAADEAEILTIATRADARRRGVGRVLLTAALDRARAMGAAQVFLEVAHDNVAARALYASMRFEDVGRRPGYYARADGRADALILARPLARPLA